MNKQEFIEALREGLSGLPQSDIQERLSFYSEMIDDRIEEGLSETDAVLEIGAVDEIVEQVVAETPITKLVKEKIKSKGKLKVWEIVLLALGSPIWLSLLLAAVAVVLSLYISLWAVIISLWAVFVSVAASGFAGIFSGILFAFTSKALVGIAIIGSGIACLGLSIFLFFGCKIVTKGTLIFTKKFSIFLKNCFIKKEEA